MGLRLRASGQPLQPKRRQGYESAQDRACSARSMPALRGRSVMGQVGGIAPNSNLRACVFLRSLLGL